MPRDDHPPTFHHVAPVGCGPLKHRAKIDLGKPTVVHSLEEMWDKL